MNDYHFPGAGYLGQLLLTVGGWNFYHAGIEWTKADLPGVYYETEAYQTRAVLLLAMQAVHPNKTTCELQARYFSLMTRVDVASGIPSQNPVLEAKNHTRQRLP